MGALFSWAEKNFRMFRGKGNCGRRERGRWEEVTAMHEERRARGDREGPWAECSLCGGEIGWGQRYYRVGGENVCRQCLADFAAQILAAYEVRGGEDV